MDEKAYRRRLIKRLRDYTPRASGDEKIRSYIAGRDPGELKYIAYLPFDFMAGRQLRDAIVDALEQKPDWARDLGKALQYKLLAHRCSWFWHQQFRVLFPAHPQPLMLFHWEAAAHEMAFCYMLGWKEEAKYLGYISHAMLNRGYQLYLSYHEGKRRGAAFMQRLFASAHEDAHHDWRDWASEVPYYERLLAGWRHPDPERVGPLLLDACQHHLAQSHMREADDYGDLHLARTPLEIHMVLRLRQLEGLALPELEHSLMSPPFDRLLEPQPVPPPDELMTGTIARAKIDWPQFDEMTSFDSVRAAARGNRSTGGADQAG